VNDSSPEARPLRRDPCRTLSSPEPPRTAVTVAHTKEAYALRLTSRHFFRPVKGVKDPLFALKRNGEVGLDNGSDIPWPDHGAVEAKVDDFAIGHVERAIFA